MSAKAAPMTKQEAMLLVNMVARNTVIMNKATNATNNKLKEQAWQTLTSKFNSAFSNLPRTSAQLRLKWENLKKAARKRCAMIRSSNLNRTKGGGKDYFPPDEVLDKVAALLGSTCRSFSVEFGGYATTTSTTSTDTSEASVNIPDEGLNLITLSEVNGDGVNIHGVDSRSLRGVQMEATPIPQHRKFFLNRVSSGTGTLAKRKYKMEEDKCKARILREKALADYLIVKKRKIELENEEKEMTITKLKIELENAKLENAKLKADLNMLH